MEICRIGLEMNGRDHRGRGNETEGLDRKTGFSLPCGGCSAVDVLPILRSSSRVKDKDTGSCRDGAGGRGRLCFG